MKLVNPANKRKYNVIVVGTGPGRRRRRRRRSAELGYNVTCFCYQDSPRRAHSHRRAGRHQRRQELPERRRQRLPPVLRHGQGRRLPRARGQRLPAGRGQRRTSSTSASRRACRSRASTAACSPTARFGGAQVSRTFYARGQTGQQLLLGAYQALERQIGAGTVKMFPRTRDARPGRGRRPGARHRRARPGHRRDRVARRPTRSCSRTGGYGNVFYLVDQRQGLQRHGDLARVQEGRRLRQPLLHADPPDLHPGHRRVPVEAHADERVAAQRRPHLGAEEAGRQARRRTRSPRPSATTTSSASTRASATSCRATSPRAPPRRCATRAAASARAGCGVYLDFARRHRAARARTTIERDATATCSRCTSGSPARTRTRSPMRIYPAIALHDGRPLGGLQPDEHHPGPVRRSARRTSPTTAPTGSAPAR